MNKKYTESELQAETAIFFDKMAERLSDAHVIICRAGASTIAEILTTGRPAIYVPYPDAKDDHQTKNAESVVKSGAGIMILQDKFTAEHLSQKLIELLNNQERLISMAKAAQQISIPNANEKLTDLVEVTINGGSGKI